MPNTCCYVNKWQLACFRQGLSITCDPCCDASIQLVQERVSCVPHMVNMVPPGLVRAMLHAFKLGFVAFCSADVDQLDLDLTDYLNQFDVPVLVVQSGEGMINDHGLIVCESVDQWQVPDDIGDLSTHSTWLVSKTQESRLGQARLNLKSQIFMISSPDPAVISIEEIYR